MSGGLLGLIDNQVNKRGTNLLPKRYRPVREAFKLRFERRGWDSQPEADEPLAQNPRLFSFRI
jgi:hypothetical protein